MNDWPNEDEMPYPPTHPKGQHGQSQLPKRRCNMPNKLGECEMHRCGLPSGHPGTHQCGDCGRVWER